MFFSFLKQTTVVLCALLIIPIHCSYIIKVTIPLLATHGS